MSSLNLDDFIEKEFGQIVKQTHNKSLKDVLKNFYDECLKKAGPPPEFFLGGESSIRVDLKEKSGFETVYYYCGDKERIKLFESPGNKMFDYLKLETKNHKNNQKIDEFISNHGGHVMLIFTPSTIGMMYSIKSKYESRYNTEELELTNFDDF